MNTKPFPNVSQRQRRGLKFKLQSLRSHHSIWTMPSLSSILYFVQESDLPFAVLYMISTLSKHWVGQTWIPLPEAFHLETLFLSLSTADSSASIAVQGDSSYHCISWSGIYYAFSWFFLSYIWQTVLSKKIFTILRAYTRQCIQSEITLKRLFVG